MDTEELKKECRNQFEIFLDAYVEGFELDRKYLESQFQFFPDPIGKFIYPYIFNIYNYAEELSPDDESIEDWQLIQVKESMGEQLSLMNKKFTDYMFHVLSTKTILNAIGISDE